MAAKKKNRLFPDAWVHKDHLEDSSELMLWDLPCTAGDVGRA